MRRQILTLLTTLGLGGGLCSTAPAALFLDPGHRGQVLIFPYYTINSGQDTLVTLSNHGPDAKAVKVRFREGRNGRVVDSFNLYLGPYDSWSGAVFLYDTGGAPALTTLDQSCTVPGLARSSRTPLPTLANGLRYRRFSTADFSQERADAGPQDVARSREGWIEMIEMGTLPRDTPAFRAVVPRLDGPPDCDWFEGAWADNGAFVGSTSAALLAPPSGQLSGRLFLIDVTEGTALALRASAIARFSTQVQHSAPAARLPDLSSARTEPGAADFVSSIAWTDAGPVRSTWSRERALDAVSAVLMQSDLAGEVNIEAGLGARTEWLLTMPTRPGHTDQALVGSTAQAPFSVLYPSQGQPLPNVYSCERVGMAAQDREGGDGISFIYKTSPPPAPVSFCHAAQVFAFARAGTTTPLLGSVLYQEVIPLDSRFKSGQFRVDFGIVPQHRLVSREGHTYEGLPVIGHAFEQIQNQNARPGVIGFYAESSPLTGTLHCTQPDATQGRRECGTAQ